MIAPLILSLAANALPALPPPAPPSLAPPASAARQTSSTAPIDNRQPPAFERRTIELGALGGYATGTVSDPQRTPTSFVQALAHFGFYFGPTFDGAMRGNFSIVIEGTTLWMNQQPSAFGGGVNVLMRYTWATGKLRPFFTGGAGVLFSDEPIPPGEVTRNYTPQAGIGLQYFLADNIATEVGYRFHHLSNSRQTVSNPGINSHLIMFGVSWFH